jgi:hypothetical protein
MSTDRYLPIDEEGYWVFDGRRVDDEEMGRNLLLSIKPVEKHRLITSMQGQEAWVEAFDAPLVLKHMGPMCDAVVTADGAYNSKFKFSLKDLRIDEWDRYHGRTLEEIPFVFSRTAQYEFFDLLESFDDESVSANGHRFTVPPWLQAGPQPDQAGFWNGIYQGEEPPGWELGREAVALPSLLPQLKLSKSRVLVLGAGNGHDAAYFAKQGHLVTAIDFADGAVEGMKARYGDLENMKVLKADAFNLPENWAARFDLVFEHTCYCAINPERRNELVKVWHKLLAPGGHLLGIFFVNEMNFGPPFGGSEWEVRERLKSGFDFLYWTRWHHSIERRKGTELVVYARRKA